MNELHFLVISIVIFVGAGIITGSLYALTEQAVSILIKIVPVFFIVLAISILTDYFVDPKTLVALMGKERNVVGWFIAVVSGIISTGPIYMWYPLLNEMQKHGVKNEFITIFLYNRAVKPALLPMMILYFGFVYTVVLTFVMIVVSIINGVTVQRILEVWK